jgi:hypothetical protein
MAVRIDAVALLFAGTFKQVAVSWTCRVSVDSGAIGEKGPDTIEDDLDLVAAQFPAIVQADMLVVIEDIRVA